MIEQRKFRQALPLLERAVTINLAQRSEIYEDLAYTFANRAIAKRGLGDLTGASSDFVRAQRAAVVHHHRNLAPIMTDLAEIRCTQNDVSAGLGLLDRAMPIMAKTYPDDPWRTAWVTNTRGYCLARQGDRFGATRALKESSSALQQRWAKDSLYGRMVADRLSNLSSSQKTLRPQ